MVQPLPLCLDVVCTEDACPVGGSPRRVYLQLVAMDVVQMPDLRCRRCSAQMVRKDDVMPKITRHGGASNAAADRENALLNPPPAEAGSETPVGGGSAEESAPVSVGAAQEASTDTAPESAEQDHGDQADECEGGEQPSAGSSSETSSEKPPPSSEPSKPAPQKRARTTASRSSKGRAGSSTARTTATSGRVTPGDD